MDFPTIQSVIDYIKSIPAKKFCTGVVYDGKGRNCVMGHLNIAIRGEPQYDYSAAMLYGGQESNDAKTALRKVGVRPIDLVIANNSDPLNPKRGAIKYLESLIK